MSATKWEKITSSLDPIEEVEEMGTLAGTSIGTPEKDKARNPFGLRAFDDSRGGTRTRDPGIMSAVL